MSRESALAMAASKPATTPPPPAAVEPEETEKGSAVENAGTPDVEAPEVETPKETEAGLSSDRFAALAKKEAAFVKRQTELKAEREALEKEKLEAKKIRERADLFEKTKAENPVEALKLIGFSETDIFNFLAAQEKKEATPEEVAEAAAKRVVEETIAARDKADAEKRAKEDAERDQKLIGQFKSDMTTVIDANKDKYEFCALYGVAAVDLAYRTVLQIIEDSKGEDVPTAEEAIQMIEELYEGEWEQMQKLNKVKSKSSQAAPPKAESPPPASTGNKPNAPSSSRSRTLSNAATATTTALARNIQESRAQKRERIEEHIRVHGLKR